MQFQLFASVESARWENSQQRLLLAASQKMQIYNINIKKKEKKPQSQHIQDSPASVPSLRTALFWSSGPAASVKTPSSFTKQSYKEVFWTIKASRLSILWQYLAKQYIMYKTSHYSLVFHCTENLGITS